MRVVALSVQTVQGTIGGEQSALLDLPPLEFRAIHALIKAGLMKG